MPSDDDRRSDNRRSDNNPGDSSGPQERAGFRRREHSEEEVDAFLSGGAADRESSDQGEGAKASSTETSSPETTGDGTSSRKPPGGTVRFNANLPRELHRQLKTQSAEEGRSMTDIAADAISTYLSDK
jgi:predicted HicB family RNase H-like nuclease